MEEYIEKILMQRFKSTEYLKDKLKYTENKVNSFKEHPESWFVEYNIEKWTLYHIEIMEELKYSSDDIYINIVEKTGDILGLENIIFLFVLVKNNIN